MKYTITTLVSLTLLFASCGKNEAPPQQPQGPAPFPVKTVEAKDATVYQDFVANLEGQQNVEIRPKVTGFIQKIYVDEGQQVKKGQLLFKLETQTLNQDAAAAQAMVRAAQVEVDRLAPLVERKIISNVQLETAKARLANAKSAYGSIATNINFGTITSPVNGVVGSLPYREGSLVSATTEMPLTTVSDAKVIRAYFAMNEKQLLFFNKTFAGNNSTERIKNVPAVSLLLVDGSTYDQKGKISAISGIIDPTTGTTQFRADFPNDKGILRSGNSGEVRIPIIVQDAILIPQNAVFEVQGKQLVYVVDKSNKVQSKVIETSGTSELDFIVSNGLASGDIVVTAGALRLKDGMEILPQNSAVAASTKTPSDIK